MTTLQIAIYGAAVSSLLAFVKFYELWRDRFRMETYLNIDGPDQDKEIVFINLSSKPIYVKYIELFWAKSSPDEKNAEIVNFDRDIGSGFQLAGHTTQKLAFTEANNFGIKQ
ncbi:hypothetical protein SAMN05216464_110117 [Mucilaginibacter pineti]|uniref:Uncharacterized protein n=1 Tax=Mucilaginibacter pineti TaxID=1391627 RepID=A0A1G7GF77_9SPHI|nr:hypothetical protein [Mucilaginibacter pineti]SDE86792.1 hypothetical protein SAMN05216464_110117 [Mucilaginibacter pineti]